jgi:hypothetical protein
LPARVDSITSCIEAGDVGDPAIGIRKRHRVLGGAISLEQWIAMAGKRDNAYYLQRLKAWPALHREVQNGRISVAEARRRAGLGGHRTRLHELKNAWTHATPSERSTFISWARSTLPMAPPPTPATKTAWSGDERMLEWAKRRIPEIMVRLDLSHAQLADQLGISRLDASLAGAMARDNRVKSPATRAALDRWLALNASV